MLSGLKDLGYKNMENMLYYDAMDISYMVPLNDDLRANRMKNTALMTMTVHLYVLPPLSQPGIIEELIFSLEYNIVWPNEKFEENVILDE